MFVTQMYYKGKKIIHIEHISAEEGQVWHIALTGGLNYLSAFSLKYKYVLMI